MSLEITPDMLRAKDYVCNTQMNVFLTGKAGSGKTTFLKYLLNDCKKRSVVVAPTGVAAINAGGVTLHSLFQIPHIMFCPETRKEFDKNNITENKRKLIRMLDLLVIDEISMVRADLLDAVDYILRRIRRIHLPFGGVQLLMVGDLQQLSPVLKSDIQDLYFRYYRTPYFYGSVALSSCGFVTVELSKIFRQTEANFLDILNAVRTNTLTDEIVAKLNARYNESYNADDGVVQVSTHVKSVEAINSKKFEKLKTPKYVFTGTVDGKFVEELPVDKELVLRKGTQVMFVRNNPRMNVYNGKIGKVVEIDSEHIVVESKGERITVEKETWENIAYESNDKSGTIEQSVVGKYTQYPLRYAWAITVHKSQGLTFDEVLIDVNAAFSHGQVYVALSRCRSLEGLHLSSPIQRSAVITDHSIDLFMQQQLDVVAKQVEMDLPKYKADYLVSMIQKAFSFEEMTRSLDSLCTQILGGGFEKKQPDLAKGIEDLNKIFSEKVFIVTNNFYKEYLRIIENSVSPLNDEVLETRLNKASKYFLDVLKSLPNPFIEAGEVEIDGQDIQELYDKFSMEYLRGLYVYMNVMEVILNKGFSTDVFLATRSVAETEFDKKRLLVFADSNNSGSHSSSKVFLDRELAEKLSEWRKAKAKELQVPAYSVMRQTSLVAIAQRMPLDKKSLQKIEGVGEVKVKKYGDEIIALVRKCIEDVKKNADNDDAEVETPKKEKKPKSINTFDVTLRMFQEGNTPEEIAQTRNLKLSTIYSHIIKFVYEGKLDTSIFVNADEYKDFCNRITENPETLYSDLEEVFDASLLMFYVQLYKFFEASENLKGVEFVSEASLLDNILELAQKDYKVEGIAYLLKLSPSVVEDKIIELYKSSQIDLVKFVPFNVQEVIANVLDSNPDLQSSTEILQSLPYYCSYFDIRCVKLICEV